MDDKVYNALSGLGVPVRKFEYDGPEPTYITFFGLFEQSALDADNREVYTAYRYQIDLWSRDDVAIAALYDRVHAALVAAGFSRNDKQELYESDTRTYHYAVRVSIGRESKI